MGAAPSRGGPATALARAEQLLAGARAWIAHDPDPATRAELQAVVDRGDLDELAERFGSELQFGTAGIRGRLGAGPARMNRATVRRVTAGLADYLHSDVAQTARAGVVIGHDARHGSADFADDAARVLTGAGIRTLRLPPRVPTPLLAFAVCRLGAAAGVMVTASHNPPADNGYKVYLGDGAQIAPPVDAQVAERIAAVTDLGQLPLGDDGEWLGDAVASEYLRAIVGALPPAEAGELPPLRIVYTPLHGVGRDLVLAAFAQAAFPAPQVVAAQAEPDPDFPTVVRPNPEEPGMLDLAIDEARRQGADLMLANDPDADRLAVAIPDAGGWRVLTGDDVGALLADYLLGSCAQPENAVVVTTVASSTLLQRMAQAAGVAYRETLTGFKWIMRAAAQAAPRRLLLGYEEALGYAVNDIVRDKDGISAALAMRQVAGWTRRYGTSLGGRLDDLAVRFGLHATRPLATELSGPDAPRRMTEMMGELRADPPRRLAGRAVTEVEDLLAGAPPRSDVLVWRCADGTRVVARPSGTEPKLKLYLQVVVQVGGGDVAAARRQAAGELDALAGELQEQVGG